MYKIMVINMVINEDWSLFSGCSVGRKMGFSAENKNRKWCLNIMP